MISALVRLECLVQPMAKADSERLHLATVLHHGCTSLITNDSRLSQAAGSFKFCTLARSLSSQPVHRVGVPQAARLVTPAMEALAPQTPRRC